MNKYVIVLALFLAGCGSTCREKTATLNATLGEVVYQSNLAYDANYINVDSLRKIDAATDQAKLALDTARLMCVSGDKGFDAQISIVEGGLNSSLDILQESKP